MNGELRVEHPIDRFGRIRPVVHTAYVGPPVVGHVVRMEDGFYAFAKDHAVICEETIADAVTQIARRCR